VQLQNSCRRDSGRKEDFAASKGGGKSGGGEGGNLQRIQKGGDFSEEREPSPSRPSPFKGEENLPYIMGEK